MESTTSSSGAKERLPRNHSAATGSTRDPYDWLRPYQQEGVDTLVEHGRFNLFDEVGIGKTPQTLVALQRLEASKVVVVCRAFSKGVWRREPLVWWPEARVFDMSGTPVQKAEALARFMAPQSRADPPRLLVASYASLDLLLKHTFQAVVFDEAHALSRRRRQSEKPGPFEKAQILCRGGRWLFNLTGTPTRKNIWEIWNYFNLIDPKEFSSYWAFIDQYFYTADGRFGKEILRPKRPEPLRELFDRFSLRRLKRQVEPQMPRMQRQKLVVDLPERQRELYRTIAEEMMIQNDAGHWILIPNHAVKSLRLRQAIVAPSSLGLSIASPHIEATGEKAEELISQGRSVLIGAPFRSTLDDLAKALKGIAPQYVMHGGQDERKNDALRQSFMDDPNPALLFCTIQMAGSWTATKASDAIACGYDWSPITNYQFEGRIDRFGQQRAMNAWYVVGRNTIDEHIIDVLDEKVRWPDFIMNPKDLLFPEVD